MADIEEWRPIKGYEGLYEVSNLGSVRSLKGHNNFNRTKVLKQNKSNTDKVQYLNVTLYDRNGGRKTIKVHRLVAMAFIPNEQNLECVNHKDENTFNNNANNLEWCTKLYNNNYGTAVQRAVQKRYKSVGFYKDGELKHKFKSTIEAGEYFMVAPQNIARAARGIRKTFHGMEVKYLQ